MLARSVAPLTAYMYSPMQTLKRSLILAAVVALLIVSVVAAITVRHNAGLRAELQIAHVELETSNAQVDFVTASLADLDSAYTADAQAWADSVSAYQYRAERARSYAEAAQDALSRAQAQRVVYADTNLAGAVAASLGRLEGDAALPPADSLSVSVTCLPHTDASRTLYVLDVLYPLSLASLSACQRSAMMTDDLLAAARAEHAALKSQLTVRDQQLRLAGASAALAEDETERIQQLLTVTTADLARSERRHRWRTVGAVAAIGAGIYIASR